ncbi:MAG TPA: helix-turn-helix domain-containing protein [Streptosporangiaceae bacterium]
MRKANLAELPCSLARTLEIVGERWAMLVLRDVCLGWNRFDEIHGHLGVARNILKARLDTLVGQGMVERRRYQQHPDRYEYLPTEKALDFVPVLLSIVAWGDRWTALDGPPMLFTHRRCGHDTTATVVCSACAAPLAHDELGFRPGPGMPAS